jgi:hypothetical protein
MWIYRAGMMRILLRAAAPLAVFLGLACGGARFPWPSGMPKPEAEADSTTYRVYIWNQGLGVLTAQDSRQGNVVHVFPGQTGVLHLMAEGRYRIIYTIEGKTYVTAMDFVPTAGDPCWGLLITTVPQTDVTNLVPIDCP